MTKTRKAAQFYSTFVLKAKKLDLNLLFCSFVFWNLTKKRELKLLLKTSI